MMQETEMVIELVKGGLVSSVVDLHFLICEVNIQGKIGLSCLGPNWVCTTVYILVYFT